jgi:hypothetical protein
MQAAQGDTEREMLRREAPHGQLAEGERRQGSSGQERRVEQEAARRTGTESDTHADRRGAPAGGAVRALEGQRIERRCDPTPCTSSIQPTRLTSHDHRRIRNAHVEPASCTARAVRGGRKA